MPHPSCRIRMHSLHNSQEVCVLSTRSRKRHLAQVVEYDIYVMRAQRVCQHTLDLAARPYWKEDPHILHHRAAVT